MRPETPAERRARVGDATTGAVVGALAVILLVLADVRGFALAAVAILVGGATHVVLQARRPGGSRGRALAVFSMYAVATLLLWLLARSS